MIQILAIGDLHIQPDNLSEINIFLNQLEKWLIQNKVDLIVILGDTLHTHETVYTECLNKALEYIKLCEKYAHTEVLIGNHDFCFAKDTPVLMYDGTIKYSQDIKIGDILAGDDNTPRNVLSLTRGNNGKMYDILQSNADTYTVTENHILCLQSGYNELIEISVKDYLCLSDHIKINFYGYKNLFDLNGRKIADNCLTNFTIVPSKLTDYYGWTTDGNHRFLLKDFTVVHNCNNQQFLTTAHPFSGWKKSYNIVDTVKNITIENYQITLSPFVPDGRFYEALRTAKGWEKSKCIFAHQLFDGAKMGPIIANGVEKWGDNEPMLISGHIHDKQKVQENLWYTGSSMQISFGEREDHTISLVKIDDNVVIEEIDIHPPSKKTVYCDISNISETKIPSDENVKVKVSVSGDSDEFKTFKKSVEYQKLIKSGVKVVFKQKKSFVPLMPSTQFKSFPDILFSLLEDDVNLMNIYNQVIGYKEICFE